ncbi:MFS transporter [Streptomyces sp. H27-D2]|uniref:MFS transporter n=1 Tax=Streptomyces sp. H27-D2 TaxID=3046304 RepID=UPI002DB6BCE0|nr:MFS transporter [Streptomyces sp. H27-D2]MEC4020335.1 MFS transporter [Streptomyces sp. H27-D2]
MSPPQQAAHSGLVPNRDFRLLLSGAAAGQIGAQVTLVALPLVAVLELDAPAFQVALLTAAETAAFLLVGLPAGAWLDRMRKLPVLIRADVVRALGMISIPAAAAADMLTMTQLYIVALLTGVATVFFDVAHQSYLPALLPKDQLVSGNGALETVRSSAQVVGPGLGGGLVQLIGAHLAIVADALGYAVSALFLLAIRHREPAPQAAGPESSLRKEIGEGLGFVLRQPLLRVIVATTGLGNFFAALLMAVQTVFLVRVLGLSPGAIGLMLSAAAIGGLAGALCAGRLARSLGQARIIWLSSLATGPFALLWPLAGKGAAAFWFALGSAVVFFGAVVYNVAQVSFRQTLCPPRLLGRMNATTRFLVWGTMPLGALVGGAVASAAGPRAAVWVCAIGFLVVPLPLLFSPLRRMRDLPAAAPDFPPDAPDSPADPADSPSDVAGSPVDSAEEPGQRTSAL